MTVIACEHIWKRYRRGMSPRSLRDALISRARRPWSRQEETDPATFWALQDVDFEATRGEAVGIMGANGAGKTTLLRLIAGISPATRGRVRVRGRVASLIELGAGFHPELTGRENVYLNGTILGMPRAEIRRKLDAIVAFAELQDFLDVPVKRYSSGMYVRLGFAVAAHADADILLIDEVLSVGDARFQQRCLGRMRELREQGTTIVLVSHNLATIGVFCESALCLHRGEVVARGAPEHVIGAYMQECSRLDASETGPAGGRMSADLITLDRVQLFNQRGEETHVFRFRDELELRLLYRCRERILGPRFTFTIRGPEGRIFQASMLLDGRGPSSIEGTGMLECRFRELPLTPGSYHIVGSVRGEDGISYLMHPQVAAVFLVEEDVKAYDWVAHGAAVFVAEAAPVVVPYEWRVTPRGEDVVP